MGIASIAFAQKQATEVKKPAISSPETYSFLKWRSIGPAVTSGRIVDLAVNPLNHDQWYLAVAAGGVWKTDNAGVTFSPLFDSQGSYSIGCIRLDPSNPNVVWVGSGENNNQRSVSYGDGVYKSEDGGKTWKNMGLKNTEHIGMIAIDPLNSNWVYVAAYGPLWSAGGERGIYKSEDGGVTWNRILHVSDNTGFNEIHMDPRDPNVLYATAHQRRRHEWTYISGGPESAIYKSSDAGKTWKKLENGIPASDKGRIALSVAPSNPDVVYAMIEGNDDDKGVYRSADRGASFQKMSGHSTAGNYYMELFTDPKNADVVYSMDTWAQVSRDGGKTFNGLGEKWKHVDNHVIWIDPDKTTHLLMGCDGGLYETFDGAKTWNFKENLPVTQFYRVAVDQSKPFYNVYGGTQDNNTLGGPSQTISASGIINADWFVTVGGDGFEPAIDPQNPDLVYSQWQYGGLVRYDKKTGEAIDIKPQERAGDPAYRFNWDAPLLVSNHKPERLYFAAQYVFKSDDRGNSWQVISPDLSRGIDRNKLPVMGRVWGMDAIAKNQSTSIYGNITALSESPKNEKLLYAGTDDGLIQVSTDGGANWSKIARVGSVPEQTLVQNIYASMHNENVVYAVCNNHRNGDFKPYLMKSSDKGKTWISLVKGLPDRGSTYCMAEDPKDPSLLFAGTEFGIYFSRDGGSEWIKLGSGLPVIAVRDIAIPVGVDDLAIATFGRGFYILDDYSFLREARPEMLDKEASLLDVRDGALFNPKTPYGHKEKSFQGASFYTAENPAPGAWITFHLKESYLSMKEKRKEREKERIKNNLPVYYPSKDSIRMEDQEVAPVVYLVISDAGGQPVRKLVQSPKKGIYRVNWDGRMEVTSPVSFYKPNPDNPYESEEAGPMALPGIYKAHLEISDANGTRVLCDAVSFSIRPLLQQTLPANADALAAFNKDLGAFRRVANGVYSYQNELTNRIKYIREGLQRSGSGTAAMITTLNSLEQRLNAVKQSMAGDGSLAKREFETLPGLLGSVEMMAGNLWSTSVQEPGTYRTKLQDCKAKFAPVYNETKQVKTEIEKLEQEMEMKAMPYTPGRFPEWNGK